ncbi:hypothetical protein BCR37DRAFT_390230 [Protomyces lactucae-debilis]|uniref:DUF5672 domain-containing protein n=1 Tax=Protomyces lactucae-debilis TaxID=2754530 RepID=A0A1Y2FUK9_PROLT|nr:uncharacterized protein BCR37DRAFT_390230 [Protomyces lactucae-debilis]ORY87700.1 hypothetical protein BCR37DRAFT_390230 [Protomyces lactucae-debilis]
MEQKYGVERFTRPSFTNDTRKVNFPDGRPVEDAHECLPSLSTKKVAVLVEMRTHLDWVYHVMHFIRTLDDDWPFVIYHSNHNEQMLRSNAELQPHIQSGKVQLHLLKTIFSSGHSVSQFLTHTPFWDALAPADHILIYQIDSTLCASSPHKIEDFFKYDYVGAPLDFSDDIEMPFNGGFSLRNRTAMIHVINHERPFEHPDNKIVWEDRWYSSVMARSSYPYRLPRGSVAATFAVEIRFYPRPAGIHRPKASLTRFSGEDSLEKLLRNCPEGKLMPDDLGGDF